MPTYGYQCTSCDNSFEVVQKITDDPLTVCDTCGGELRKKIFPVGIQFKGSGFYVNDYSGNSKEKAAPAAESGTPSPTESDSAAKPAEAATPAAASTTAKSSDTTPVSTTPASSTSTGEGSGKNI